MAAVAVAMDFPNQILECHASVLRNVSERLPHHRWQPHARFILPYENVSRGVASWQTLLSPGQLSIAFRGGASKPSS
jgi:hypothetical protein